MKTSEGFLVDTNILVYASFSPDEYDEETREYYEISGKIRNLLWEEDITCFICPQILVEYYAVITNSRRVRQPKTSQEALSEVRKYFQLENLKWIFPPFDLVERISKLIEKIPVVAQDIFDIQIAVTMISNNVYGIATFDDTVFRKVPEIKVINPKTIIFDPNQI